MKPDMSIEAERLHLIAALAEMDMDRAMANKLKKLIYRPLIAEPCAISTEKLKNILE